MRSVTQQVFLAVALTCEVGIAACGGKTGSDAPSSDARPSDSSDSPDSPDSTPTVDTTDSLDTGSGGDSAFPTTPGNVFSLQFRNRNSVAITVWLEGSQPPCASATALQCDSVPGGVPWNPAAYSEHWAALKSVFTESDTRFFIYDSVHDSVYDTAARSHEVDVLNHVDLEPGETLRLQLPVRDGHPEWYFARNGVVQSVGTKAWVTQKGVSMPASERSLLFEYNVQATEVYWDLSAVDGLNANGTMTYEGPGCADAVNCGCSSALPKSCATNLDAYTETNDGCPYIQSINGASVCSNPKFYSTIEDAIDRPAWVVPTSAFTTDRVSSDYPDVWNSAGRPTGAEMASAASGDPLQKQAYHIWWSTNAVGAAWLRYLQANTAGVCDAYGWAYDEMKWKSGDTFDANGNPSENTTIAPLVRCDIAPDTYVNIDITKVM